MAQTWNNAERRLYIRIEKHFIISYFDKSDPAVKHNVSQLKNISMGGMCFVAPQNYRDGTRMEVNLKTPYVADMVNMEGVVLESREKIPNMLYEVRLQFGPLSKEAEFILKKIVETFLKISEEKKA